MQSGINCLFGVMDYYKTGNLTREAEIGLGFIWKFMALTIKRIEAGAL